MKDRFNREIDYLRLSVTDQCNLRCVYCMEDTTQEFLPKCSKLSDDEMIRIVTACARLGIKKVRLTGGEPLVRPGIVELIKRIHDIDGIEEIYLTTNGTVLSDQVKTLAHHGLKGVNISLDSLKADRFHQITRRGILANVLKFIDECLAYGLKVKLNTVLVDEVNQDEILDFVRLTLEKPIDVRFIELMPIGVGKADKGGPATYVCVNQGPGKVGFISAVSNCFCESCNRIRVSADGFLKQCLHFKFGVSLKDLIRAGITDEALQHVIYEQIYHKPEKHLFNQENIDEEVKFMNQIGG
ncbi:GTP 3',8-cyclase MoaA [Turicibacter sanguinis]|uniref:GTP 3',8-cyclase MoaA n=1 Tax=Turicibacter sanguinis TaxID=154288 RepID=UPI00232C75F6|nr:GTP 3',8-cyclase MoaA [Turicibacter sanguinis]MDB8585312.1 GTP 3',8-cyclase MoaA [Turicibacter sanguinis]